MRAVLALPAGRVAKWVVLVVWVLIMVAVFPLASKLFSSTNNSLVGYLSRGAESTQVEELKKQLSTGSGQRVVVVYERAGGIRDEDTAKAKTDLAEVVRRYPANAGTASSVTPSGDGSALVFGFTLPSGDPAKEGANTGKAVDETRELVGQGKDGLTVRVGGPGGVLADQLKSFGGLHTTVLLATIAVVALLLLIIYRSPVLWIAPLISVAFAAQGGQAVAAAIARHTGFTVTSGSAFVLVVLTYGAGTDYALLLIARYREELRRHEDRHDAMKAALRRSGPAIIASAATVGIALLCLLFASMNANRALGPVGFGGIAFALLATMTLLPAVLVICGRWVMWPAIPRPGGQPESKDEHRMWHRIGDAIERRPRKAWIGTLVLLGALAAGLFTMNLGLKEVDGFTGKPEAVEAQELLLAHYPPGITRPVQVISNTGQLDAVLGVVRDTPGVANAVVTGKNDTIGQITTTLRFAPDTREETGTLHSLRDRVHQVRGANALVGGHSAILIDVAESNLDDAKVVIPLVLLTILIVLMVLLRAVVAPLVLIATVVISFATTLGLSAVVFQELFGFAGVDATLPLQAFVFLVALGVDYNIFLMGRAQEEARGIGTTAGMRKALAATGGVITSAGVVLAATFAVLVSLPLVAWVQIGFVVALGVVIDTVVVRTVLVPATTMDLGDRAWWPGNRVGRVAVPRSRYDRIGAERDG
ncbi:MMPL family transporter [Actinosynnema sp. ALI-1.44]|uniref:MMPL family transporter n=1 Tax=Actinosynnema sp. ALI-1.44 TaxID=1933779 RepID=UPI0009FBA5D5|nr:MMPL family transporter [Actinosynnema sp. ALI-1.44]